MKDDYNLGDFLDDLTDAFMPMRHVDDDSQGRWAAVVHRKLHHYSAATLRRAVDDLQSNRKARGHPSISEMLDACGKASLFEEAQKPRHLDFEGKSKFDAVDRYISFEERFEMLVNSPASIVKEAAREGCHGAVRSFVLRLGRLPNSLDEKIEWFRGEEPHSVRVEAKLFDEAYENCVRFEVPNEALGDWKKLGGTKVIAAWRRLGDSMLKNREDLRTKILGKVE